MSATHHIHRVSNWRVLLERLEPLDARTDRWLCVQPTPSPQIGQICADIVDALGAGGSVAANAGHSDLRYGLETWLHHAADNVVILGAADEESLIVAIGAVRDCGVTLWLVEPCREGDTAMIDSFSSVIHPDEHELLRVLPRPVGMFDRSIYAAHFLEYSFRVHHPPADAWERVAQLHLACARPVAEALYRATDRSHLRIDALLDCLFGVPATPIESLVRLRHTQLELLRREWLLEQDDYGASYQLATLLASGEAPRDPGELGLRLARCGASRAIRAVSQPPRNLRR